MPQFNVKFDFRGPTNFAKPEEGKSTGLPNPFTQMPKNPILQAEKKTIVQKNLFDNKAIPRAPEGLTSGSLDQEPKPSLFDYHQNGSKSMKTGENAFAPVKFNSLNFGGVQNQKTLAEVSDSTRGLTFKNDPYMFKQQPQAATSNPFMTGKSLFNTNLGSA